MVMFHSYVMLVYQRVAPNHPVVMKDHELYWNLWWRLGIPHFLETPIEVLRVKLYTEPLIFPHRPGIPNHLATWRRSWRNNHWHLIKSISKHRYPANTPLSLSWWIFIFHEKSQKNQPIVLPFSGESRKKCFPNPRVPVSGWSQSWFISYQVSKHPTIQRWIISFRQDHKIALEMVR